MPTISLTVNGQPVTEEVDAPTLLIQLLRDQLKLTGTHTGCDTSQCGACVVHVNGEAVKSCSMFALQADGADVRTVESLANGDDLHPMQVAFHEHHALQCGFCTPGMLMASIAFVRENPNPTEDEVRNGLEGNLCRCTGYQNIVQAVLAGAKSMRG